MRRLTALLGLPLLMIAAGCGPAGPNATQPGGPTTHRWAEFDQRAVEVAEAWRPGPTWSQGYVPLEQPTVLVGDPRFTPETEQAFRAGWYRDQIAMPTAHPAEGTVRFPDGTLTVPLVSAAEAYRQLDQGDPPPCEGRPTGPGRPKIGGPTVEPGPDGWATGQPARPTVPGPTVEPGPDGPVSSTPQAACIPLTVTAVTLGTAPVRTSRGEAQVPAWLFTVEELGARVARLAVAPGAVGTPPTPVPPARPGPPDVVGAQDLVRVDGARVEYRLGVGACDTGITPLVAERDDVVVVGGGVTRSTGMCTEQLVLAPVTVTLKAPLGDRPVLDVLTAAPLSVAGR